LRLSAQFTEERISPLRFDKNLLDEMAWAYEKFGEDVYTKLNELKPQIEAHLKKHDVKLKASQKNDLFSQKTWAEQLALLNETKKLMAKIGSDEHNDFNTFKVLVESTIKKEKLKLDAKVQKRIFDATTWKSEEAERVIKKKEKDGTFVYEADSDLRDSENVPLDEEIQNYFEHEVLQHIPDAWIDHKKTTKGYEISFTRYFYNYVPPSSIEEITAEILQLEKETDGILNEIVNH
jgi:type I restriction enzyme M protein